MFQWGRLAFGSPVKALGFVVLAEGVMTFCSTAWRSVVALGYLVLINAIATGGTIALDAVEDLSTTAPAAGPAADASAWLMAALTSLEARLAARETSLFAAPRTKRTRKRSARKPSTRQLHLVPEMSEVPAAAGVLDAAFG